MNPSIFAREPSEAPPHCPNTWRAEHQKEKCPFHFRKNPPPRNAKSKKHFFFLVLPSKARRWRGFRGAYDLVSLHHALRASRMLASKKPSSLLLVPEYYKNPRYRHTLKRCSLKRHVWRSVWVQQRLDLAPTTRRLAKRENGSKTTAMQKTSIWSLPTGGTTRDNEFIR